MRRIARLISRLTLSLLLAFAAAGAEDLPKNWLGEYSTGDGGGAMQIQLTGDGYAGKTSRGEIRMNAASGASLIDIGSVKQEDGLLTIYGKRGNRTAGGAPREFIIFSGELAGGAWGGYFFAGENASHPRTGSFRVSAIDGKANPISGNAPGKAAWIFDSTLDMPFAMVRLPPGFSAEGNVAWDFMPPVRLYSMWVRFVNPEKRVIVEIAVPMGIYREETGGYAPKIPANRDAKNILRTFISPLIEVTDPGAEKGNVKSLPDSPLLEATRIDLANNEGMFSAAGRFIRESKADTAEMTATFGAFKTTFTVAAWSIRSGRHEVALDAKESLLSKWTGLLCVTAPVDVDAPEKQVRELLDGIIINPAWQDKATMKLAFLSKIEESPPFYVPDVEKRWAAMNRTGMVLSPSRGAAPASPAYEYEELPPGDIVLPESGRYTYVNAALDGCFLSWKSRDKLDAENIKAVKLLLPLDEQEK